MYLLAVTDYSNGRTEFYGPFPTKERAFLYAKSFEEDGFKFFTLPLIIPYSVVKEVVWR